MNKKARGFTIVELLIVIVVIAVLAAVSIVAYNGIQSRARDAIRKNDIAILARALSMYNTDKGNYVEIGSGCGNGGVGWVSLRNSGAYGNSITDCLMTDEHLSKDVADPSGCRSNLVCGTPTTAYMKLNCHDNGGKYAYLFARLETSSEPKPDGLSTFCPNSSWYDTYGMNYAVRVD